MQANKYRVIGVMSGTSLDGLDVALCTFNYDNKWTFKIEEAVTIDYSKDWKSSLENAQNLNALDFIQLHRKYGAFIGKQVKGFIGNRKGVDFIASHGHTVFHKPDEDITFQVGCGAYIAAESGITTVSDFRTLDIALGGQGAPLVPIGDKLLFSDYDACINIGGFANISFDEGMVRSAYDICPVNFVLNQIMEIYFNVSYDNEGLQGRMGKVNEQLLQELNQLIFYDQDGPKSLAREWVENEFWPVLDKSEISVSDKISTCYAHFSDQIAKIIEDKKFNNVLFTGGGAYNVYLLELISNKCNAKLIVPENSIIDYKEALIFAFLGVLRYEQEVNCLKSVTGACKDNSGGCIYLP